MVGDSYKGMRGLAKYVPGSRLASGHGVARGPKAGFLGETPSEIDGLSAQISVVNVAETIRLCQNKMGHAFLVSP